MKIYINNVEVSSEVLPTDIPTLDESLETLSFALISNTNQFPIAPMQPVKIVFNNGEEVYFITTTDSGSISCNTSSSLINISANDLPYILDKFIGFFSLLTKHT